MEKKAAKLGRGLAALLMGSFLLWSGPAICSAEIVTGQAVIVQGDVDSARRMAREDAMRNYVERKVGVYIDSRTEVNMGMVVSDRIVSQSTGYVQLKDVKREWQQGEIYMVELDLEADQGTIQTAVADVRKRMQMQLDGTTRTALQVAVSGKDENGRNVDLSRLNLYMQAKLEDISGFRVFVNDQVRVYMATHGNMGNMAESAEVRRLARVTRQGDEDSLLRGTLSTVNVRNSKGSYVATVNASFELVGLDDNMTSSFSDYFTAAGSSPLEAVNKANDIAVRRAAEKLGQKALEVIQRTQRGGVQQLQATAVFKGISNRAVQEQLIVRGITAANCRIVRSSFNSYGEYKVFLKSSSYDSLHSLRMAIMQNIAGISSGNDNEAALGSTVLYFTF